MINNTIGVHCLGLGKGLIEERYTKRSKYFKNIWKMYELNSDKNILFWDDYVTMPMIRCKSYDKNIDNIYWQWSSFNTDC
jgi:hypothetical protein